MPLNSIEGKWIGESKFDEGYPLVLQTVYVSFTMELTDQNGIIKGICIDDHTKHFNIAPATIEGIFKDNVINLIKTQPCQIGFNKSGETYIEPNKHGVPVQLMGKLRKKIFSSEYYFKGKLSQEVQYVTRWGKTKKHIFSVIWSMKRAT